MASPTVATAYYLTETTPCGVTMDTVIVSMGNCTVAVNELIMDNEELIIYPNPANQLLVISSSLLVKEVRIFNVLGECVLMNEQLTTNNKQLTLAVSSLAKGIYFVEATTEKGILREKFIKE